MSKTMTFEDVLTNVTILVNDEDDSTYEIISLVMGIATMTSVLALASYVIYVKHKEGRCCNKDKDEDKVNDEQSINENIIYVDKSRNDPYDIEEMEEMVV